MKRQLHGGSIQRSFGTLAAALLTLCFSAAGCDERPPPVPLRDSSAPGFDARVPPPEDAGGTPFGRRDGGALLPSVDETIVLPYRGDEVERDLDVTGEVGTMDVFFSIDTTGSFGGEIDNLQSQLRTSLLPGLRDRVADLSVGVGRFEDFPLIPFGDGNDRPFRLLTAITSNDARVESAVASLDAPLGNGADSNESGAEALYQIATGEGVGGGVVPPFEGVPLTGGGTVGGVGFREEALRVVVHVTDAPTHDAAAYAGQFDDAHSLAEAITALSERGIITIGIASGAPGRGYLEQVAIGTGAVVPPSGGQCPTGIDGASRAASGGVCPLVFDVRENGSGLSETIVDAIADLLATVRYREVWGESDDRLEFVRSIEAFEATPPPGAPMPERADRRPPDGIDDTFLQVTPGTQLGFRVRLRNEGVPPADYDQVFRIVVRIVGDGITLTSRSFRIVVPAGRVDAGVPDAGQLDSGRFDAGARDAGPLDAGASDAGPPDASPDDAGSTDAGSTDAGDASTDAG
ncbi:MAG: hypothetical protein AB8I08_04670 [Sandaracinaceae bacterium]